MGEFAQEVAVRPTDTMKRLPLILTVPVVLVFLFSGGCDRDRATSPSTVTESRQISRLVADETILGPGDSTTVRAYVVEADGMTAAVGCEVEFGEMLGKRSGTFTKSSSVTDASGMATTIFWADIGVSGRVTLKARVGASPQMYLELRLAVGAAQLQITGEPTSVNADGTSSVEGSVLVLDSNRAPLAEKQVRLVAGEPFEDRNHDGLFTPDVDLLLEDLDDNGTWTEIGSVDPICTTGVGGIGHFTYRAGRIPGTIMVKGTVDQVSADLVIELQKLPPITTMTLERERPEIQVVNGGGIDNVLLTATLYDAIGEIAPAGIPVTFSIREGPRGGETFVDAADGVYQTWTGQGGKALAMLVAGTEIGIVTIVATTGSQMQLIDVAIVAGYPNSIELHAEDERLTFWAETKVCAYVYDLYGHSVRDETVVLFTVGEEGMIIGEDGLGIGLTKKGEACATYRSLGPAMGTDYIAEIEACVQGMTICGRLQIDLEQTPPPPIAELEISATRSRVNVRRTDPVEDVGIFTRAFTYDGQAVGAGYPVNFWIESGPQGGESLNGEGWGPVQAYTNQDGLAQVTLEPGTLPGPVQMRAQSGTAQIMGIEIHIVAGPPVAIACTASPDEIGVEETSEIRAYLYDEYHNQVQDGVVVSFQVDEGMVNGRDGPGSSQTQEGIAIATYTCLPPEAGGDGIATITCTAEGGELVCQTNVRIPMRSTGLAELSLTASESELMVAGAGGTEEMTLWVTGYNESGQNVGAGHEVRFDITCGPNGGERFVGTGGRSQTVTTDAQGRASATLKTGTTAGRACVVARNGAIRSNEIVVPIYAGPAEEVHCWPGDSNLGEDDTTTVFVIVRDLHDNPVADSTIVTFLVDEGKVNGTAYEGALFSYTNGGYATGLYRTFEAVPGGDGWADIACSVLGAPTCGVRIAIPSTLGEPASVELNVANSEISVAETGGVDQTTLAAIVKNPQGGRLGPGIDVVFTILDGPTGARIDGQPITVTRATGNDGVARVTLTAGTESGTVDVRACVGAICSNVAGVAITAGPPVHIECYAPEYASCNEMYVDVHAYVTDIHYNAVRDGTAVWFRADAGMIVARDGEGNSAGTEYGIAYGWYFAPLGSECDDWTATTITFEAAGLTCTQVITKGTTP